MKNYMFLTLIFIISNNIFASYYNGHLKSFTDNNRQKALLQQKKVIKSKNNKEQNNIHKQTITKKDPIVSTLFFLLVNDNAYNTKIAEKILINGKYYANKNT